MIDLRLGRYQDVLPDVPDASARLILTSPPYDNARDYEGTVEPVDFAELAAFALRVLMPGGVLAMVLDGAVNDGETSTTPYRVICEWAALKGWRFLQVLAYGREGAPGEYRGRFRRDHEPILVFVRDGAEHVCNKALLAVASRHDPARAKGAVRARSGEMEAYGVGKNGRREIRPFTHRGSLWWYGQVTYGHDPSASSGHPATFAEAFARDAVTVWSNPGDLVLDPFAGSATTGRACADLGRRFIGAERVRKYHAIGLERLAQQSFLSLDLAKS